MNRTALLMLAALLAGCDVRAKNPATGDENVSIKADENQVTFNVPFASGQVKLPEGAMSTGDFDIEGHEGGTVHFAFKAPTSAENVRAYFVDQFKQKRVEAAAAGTSVSGKTKDGDPFVISVEPAAQGSH